MEDDTTQLEVFPWNDNLKTHIPVIDDQHRKLIGLINHLTHSLVNANTTHTQEILDELLDYADYHFKTEEAIWQQHLADDNWVTSHHQSHAQFIPDIKQLIDSERDTSSLQTLDKIVKFLIRWLAFHIIDSDRRLAMVVNNLEKDLSLEDAKLAANEEMQGSVQLLIDTILSMYESISSTALELMRERTTRHQAQQELIETNKKLEQMAITDQLTGLYNRRKFEEVFEQEIQRAHRSASILTFIMFDIDHFKSLNDFYGHTAGDEALKKLSAELQRLCRRPGDYVFRLGGEEFGILITDHSSHSGAEFAEIIRQSIENLKIDNEASNASPYMTISVGVFSHVPADEDNIEVYLRSADLKLYTAKETGRNRVIS